jgi:hypothetical protein
MPRAQNAHAYVNAGFLFQLKKTDKGKVMKKPKIVYGGINPYFVSILRLLLSVHKYETLEINAAFQVLVSDLKADAARSSETLVSYHITTWCHIPQDNDLNLHCHNNLKS